jgi:hypothetical protein
MLEVERSEFSSAADALTILEQIEGALAYIDTVGTRAEDAVYKRLRLKLTAAFASCITRCTKGGTITAIHR